MTDAEFKEKSYKQTDVVHKTIEQVYDILFTNTKGLDGQDRWLVFSRVISSLWRNLYRVEMPDKISGEVNDRR